MISPLGSSMVAPSVSQMMEDFHSSREELAPFVVSVYLLGYAFGPLILAPLSELHGRMIIYNVCNVLYLIFTIACAISPNLSALIVFRLLAGTAGSAPLTIGAGSLADMIQAENRGLAMSAWVLGPVLGPVVGPLGVYQVFTCQSLFRFTFFQFPCLLELFSTSFRSVLTAQAGGYLAQAKGWRWTFWVLAMAVSLSCRVFWNFSLTDARIANTKKAVVVAIMTVAFLRESNAYTLLQRKTRRLQKETGNSRLRSALDTGQSARGLFILSILRPTKMLLFSPIVSLLALYIAIIYGYLYLLFTTMSGVFERNYGFSPGDVGLAYLGIGVGSVAGLVFQSICSDLLFQSLTFKHGASKPEYRLPPLFVTCWFIPTSLFWYGWTTDQKVQWMAPIIGTSLLGFGMLNAFTTVSIYLVDAYTAYAASAVAATTVLRSLGGAFLPLAGGPMYASLGLAWGNSLLAFIALATCPLPFIFYRYGEQIRRATSVRL